MVKKLLTLAFGLVFAFSAMAQMGAGNAVVPQSDIQFWTGSGSNRAVVAITWETDDEDFIGIAWGVQWNGTLNLAALMDTIDLYDDNLTIAHGTTTYTLINNLTYTNSELGLNLVGTEGWWWYNWIASDGTDKTSTSLGASGDIIVSGDFVDWMQMGTADTMIMAPNPNAGPVEPMPEDAEIAASDILYWVGEGNNKVVFAVNWADTALAWGYRFGADSVFVSEIIDALVAADPRLSIEGTSSFVSDFRYADENITDTLTITPHDPSDYSIYFNMQVNHISSMIGAAGHAVGNGDFVKFADTYAAVKADSTWIAEWSYWDYTYVWPMMIHPVSIPSPVNPVPEEGTIAASDILYWVGTGAHRVVMAVNWADTALAWGYRFDGSKTVADMMTDIAEADNRFSYTKDGAYVGDIVFVVAEGDTLRKQPYSWWESKNNGVSDMGMAQTLADGDFEKWAEPAAGVVVDSSEYDGYWYYTYVYPMEVHAVSVPVSIDEVNSVEVRLYPNPAAVVLNVTFDALENNSEVELFDMTGRRVMVRPVAAGSSSVQMPVNQLAEGVYMLRVAGATARVVVAR